jgi:hypothetical protein
MPLPSSGGSGTVSAIENGSNNRIATFSSSDALNGEANLTFDGSELTVVGSVVAGSGSATGVIGSNGSQTLTLQTGHGGTSGSIIVAGSGGDIRIKPNGNGRIRCEGKLLISSTAGLELNAACPIVMGSTKHMQTFTATCNAADSGDNSVITEVRDSFKLPARSIITQITAVVTQLSNLTTYLVNLSLSTEEGTSADGALVNASTTITVPELLGAGASNTYQQNSAIAMAGTAADIVLSSGGTTKVVYINRPNTTIVGTADTYLYVCNAGTGNGTTNPSTNGILEVFIEYIGLD